MIDYFRAIALLIFVNGVLFAAVADTFVIDEQVDVIELNHFHDVLGRHVYDQAIFWDWENSIDGYAVRAWVLVEANKQFRQTRDGAEVRWRDGLRSRSVRSKAFRETWTQCDPERANKKLLAESDRISLVAAKPLVHDVGPIPLVIEPISDPVPNAVPEVDR